MAAKLRTNKFDSSRALRSWPWMVGERQVCDAADLHRVGYTCCNYVTGMWGPPLLRSHLPGLEIKVAALDLSSNAKSKA